MKSIIVFFVFILLQNSWKFASFHSSFVTTLSFLSISLPSYSFAAGLVRYTLQELPFAQESPHPPGINCGCHGYRNGDPAETLSLALLVYMQEHDGQYMRVEYMPFLREIDQSMRELGRGREGSRTMQYVAPFVRHGIKDRPSGNNVLTGDVFLYRYMFLRVCRSLWENTSMRVVATLQRNIPMNAANIYLPR